MQAVILAGGLGTRLKPFTEVIPKPLLPIGEKAVLEIQIEHLKKFGFNEIFLATNYKSDYIERFLGNGSDYGVNLIISKEKKSLGTAGPLTLLKSKLKKPFIVMNGDILSSLNLLKFYEFAKRAKCKLCVSIKKIIMPYAFGNIYFDKNNVTNIEEKPDIVTYALAGIYVMNPGIFEFIPENEYYGMDSLIKQMLKLKVPISKYEVKDYWIDIGHIKDYESAEKDFKKNFYKTKK